MPNIITRVLLEGGKRLKMKEGTVIEAEIGVLGP